MKQALKRILNENFGWETKRVVGDRRRYREIYEHCRGNTMVGGDDYRYNLELVDSVRNVPGDVVECGVWKGGMSAGMAMLLGKSRKYYLFDSFEGLPPAEPSLDGEYASEWQKLEDKTINHNNCTAAEADADAIMRSTGVDYQLVKGWFENTVPDFQGIEKIAVLRLDGDWYESTMTTLEKFFPLVSDGGLILVDDYYAWEGCSKALHDYLSKEKSAARIRGRDNFVYIIK
jgi:O-methyltransferase